MTPSMRRRALHAALSRPVGFGVCMLVTLAEWSLRIAIVGRSSLLLALAVPPLSGVLLGLAVDGYRLPPGTSMNTADAVSRFRASVPSLLAYVLAGHLVALFVAVPLFLLLAASALVVDTVVRFVRYAIGAGTILNPFLLLFAVRVMVVGAVVTAWIGLIGGFVRLQQGDGVGEALWASIRQHGTRPRRAVSLCLVTVLALTTVSVGTMVLVIATDALAAAIAGVVVMAFLVVIGGFTLAFLVAYTTAQTVQASKRPIPSLGIDRWTVIRIGLVVLLFGSVVAGAAAIRFTETRPMADPDPLPHAGSGSAIYETAYTNVRQHNYRIVETNVPADGETVRVIEAHDRSQRRLRITFESDGDRAIDGYLSTGTMYGTALGGGSAWGPFGRDVDAGTIIAVPGYAIAEGDDTDPSLPEPGTGDWTVEARDGSIVTLRLDEPRAAVAAVHGQPPSDATYREGWVEATVDVEGGTVIGARARANVTDGAGEAYIDQRNDWSVETGISMDRPSALGAPSPLEVLWRIAIY